MSTALWHNKCCTVALDCTVLLDVSSCLSFLSQVKTCCACTWVMSEFLRLPKKPRVFPCRTGRSVRSSSYVGSTTSVAVSASSTLSCTAAPPCCIETPHAAKAVPHAPPRGPQSLRLSAPGLHDWSSSHTDKCCVEECVPTLSHASFIYTQYYYFLIMECYSFLFMVVCQRNDVGAKKQIYIVYPESRDSNHDERYVYSFHSFILSNFLVKIAMV